MNMPHSCRRRLTARQDGVALIIALILLVVLAFGSAVAARTAISSDMISKNLRAQGLALQAAELALRYCEQQIAVGGFNVVTALPIDNEWEDDANWTASSVTIPAGVLGTIVDYDEPPTCLIRRMAYGDYVDTFSPLVAPDAATPESRGISSAYLYFFRITARGYSPDFDRDGDGNAVSGAEVWVQSLIRTVL